MPTRDRVQCSNTFFKETSVLRELLNAARTTGHPSGASTCTPPTRQKALVATESWKSHPFQPNLAPKRSAMILDRLTAAEAERYLHTKYVGQKRFSLEGGELHIAAMIRLIQQSRLPRGVQEIVIGGAPVAGVQPPSHLEIVNPVVEGSCARAWTAAATRRANRCCRAGARRRRFCRPGREPERPWPGKPVATPPRGTVHIIINNQIGFTTSDPRDKALHHLLYRHREDGRVACAARQRRRSGSRGAGMQLAPEFRRSSARTWWTSPLLPQAGPQRAGHPLDPAADVQEDCPASRHAQAVRRQAGCPGPGRDSGRRHGQGHRAAMDAGKPHRRSGADQLQEQVRRRTGRPSWARSGPMRWRHRHPADRVEAPGRAITTIPRRSPRTSW